MPRSARSRIAVAATVGTGVVLTGGAVLMYALMAGETRFARPDPAFTALVAEVAAIPGVSDVRDERWVEAPLFVDPQAWVNVTVTAEALDDVWALACAAEYPDAVSWGFEVTTVADTRVSFFGEAAGGCPEIGFDPAPAAAEIARLAPGQSVQAAIWDGRFALTSMGDVAEPGALLSLVAGADTVRSAAGIDADTRVEVSGPLLGVIIGPGEASRYHVLISRLIDTYGATGVFLGGGGTPIDGVEKVQLSAPAENHTAIEREIATSGLPIADLPVRFLP